MKLLRVFVCVALAFGMAQPHALADFSYDFGADDGGFTVANEGGVEDPWVYSAARETWSVGGSTDVGAPTSSGLLTNTYQLDEAGSIDLSFDHRYSIEWDGTRWDGAALMYRVNDNGFRYVEGSQFVTEGYVDVITGNNALNGLEGFSDVSAGYFDEEYITSVVQLGDFNAGDNVQIEFLGAWDEFARGNPDGTVPNWEIDSVTVIGQLTVVPDFPLPPLFVGGEGTIGQDIYDSSRSNEVFGTPQEVVPGFSGRIVTFDEHAFTLSNHTIAEEVLDDYEGITATGAYDVVDMAGLPGTFGKDLPYPNGVNNDSQSDFAVEVTADVVIPAGTWTIGFGSDDGGSIRIPGISFDDWLNNDSIDDDELRFEQPRAHGWTVGSFTLNEPLETTLTGQFYERGGGDSFEIAVIDEELVETPNADEGWVLLGDGVFDWSVTTISDPLLSADLSAEVVAPQVYRFDVDGGTDEADQMVLENPDPDVYTTILDIDGATFQIAGEGEFSSGDSFQIIVADQILGTPTITSRNPAHTWAFDSNTGFVTFGAGGLIGDYNSNGELDVEDLDLQAAAIAGGQDPPEFDLTADGVVNEDDRVFWLHDLKGTWVGDADLNGLFDSGDFVAVFVEGKYETGEAAGWAQGDWNADLVFDSGDFVSAFVDGGYEIGEFPGAVQAVPEPSSLTLILLSLAGLLGLARRR